MSDCKINQENIESGTASVTSELIADLYLVELSEGFSVISSAPRSRRLVEGSDISEILSFKVSHELRKYLLSYGEMPIVIPTFVGDALILPQLFASSRLFAMIFFKNSKPDALPRVAVSERFSGRVCVMETHELSKMSKWDVPLADRLEAVLDIADKMLEASLISVVDDNERTAQKCKLLFEGISELVGVGINLAVGDDVSPDECFDARLFTAFCLSMLLLCERHAKADTADVHVFKKNFGVSVSISFASARKISRVLNPDVAHFNAISDANNMIFHSSFDGSRFEVSFTPSRKDWSLLELKLPNEFTI